MSKKPLKKDELKRRMNKKKRKEGSRLAQPERYLIICEGKETEPCYFEGIKKRVEKKYDERINERISITSHLTIRLKVLAEILYLCLIMLKLLLNKKRSKIENMIMYGWFMI